MKDWSFLLRCLDVLFVKDTQFAFQLIYIFLESSCHLQVKIFFIGDLLEISLVKHIVDTCVSPVWLELHEVEWAHHHIERLKHPGPRLDLVPIPNEVDAIPHASKLTKTAKESNPEWDASVPMSSSIDLRMLLLHFLQILLQVFQILLHMFYILGLRHNVARISFYCLF